MQRCPRIKKTINLILSIICISLSPSRTEQIRYENQIEYENSGINEYEITEVTFISLIAGL